MVHNAHDAQLKQSQADDLIDNGGMDRQKRSRMGGKDSRSAGRVEECRPVSTVEHGDCTVVIAES